jgi:O-acetylserine/cysteine efflux transporter
MRESLELKPLHIVLAVLPPVLWATGYSFGKGALVHFQPLFATAMTYAIGGVALFRPASPIRTPWRWLLLISVLGCSLQSALIFSGVALVDSSLANLVVQAQVPFAIIAAALFGLERFSPSRLTGVAVSILGIAVVLGSPGSGSSLSGLLLIVAGTASWGIGQALIRRHSRDSNRQLIGVMSLLATPQLLIVSFAVEQNHLHLLATGSAYEWFGVALLGLGSFVAAYLIWYWLLERNRMDQVAPFALLMPLIGMFIGVAFFGETLTSGFILGSALVLAGLVITLLPRANSFANESRIHGQDINGPLLPGQSLSGTLRMQ